MMLPLSRLLLQLEPIVSMGELYFHKLLKVTMCCSVTKNGLYDFLQCQD